MSGISEDAVEQAMLEWLAGLGWSTGHGPDISPPDTKRPLLTHLLSGKLRLPETVEQVEDALQ